MLDLVSPGDCEYRMSTRLRWVPKVVVLVVAWSEHHRHPDNRLSRIGGCVFIKAYFAPFVAVIIMDIGLQSKELSGSDVTELLVKNNQLHSNRCLGHRVIGQVVPTVGECIKRVNADSELPWNHCRLGEVFPDSEGSCLSPTGFPKSEKSTAQSGTYTKLYLTRKRY